MVFSAGTKLFRFRKSASLASLFSTNLQISRSSPQMIFSCWTEQMTAPLSSTPYIDCWSSADHPNCCPLPPPPTPTSLIPLTRDGHSLTDHESPRFLIDSLRAYSKIAGYQYQSILYLHLVSTRLRSRMFGYHAGAPAGSFFT